MTDALLELLVPERAPGEAGHGRTVAAIQLVRILAGLGHGPRAAEVDLDLARAEVDFAERLRTSALELVESLFGASLPLEPGVPVPWPGRRSSGPAAWRELLALEGRGVDLPLPSLPGPEEQRADVSRRLLHAGICLGLAPGRAALWRAFLERAEGCLADAELRFVALADDASLDFDTRATAIAGVLGACLERGAPAAARDRAMAHLDLAAASLELRRPMAWALAAAGELELAAELAVPTPARLLPAVVAELGQRQPELRELLTGGLAWELERREAGKTQGPADLPSGPGGLGHKGHQCRPARIGRRRCELGAAVVAVFRMAEAGAELAHFEAAPALAVPRAEHLDWVADRSFAPWDPAELEAEALANGRTVVVLPDPETPAGRRALRSARASACRALALVPLGRPARAWVRIEFEHQLVPTRARLEAFGAALGRHLGIGLATRPTLAAEHSPDPTRLAARIEPLLAGLGRRRWWYLQGDGEPLATGGLEDRNLKPGGGRLLARVRADGIARVLEPGEAAESACLQADSRAAMVLPVGPAWSPAAGWLAVEGRGTGLGPSELAGVGAALEGATPWLLLESFAAWHRAHHGFDVHLDPSRLEPPGVGLSPGSSPGPIVDPTVDPTGLGSGELLARLCSEPGGVHLISGSRSSGRRLAADLAVFLATGPAAVAAPPELHLRGATLAQLDVFLDTPGPRILEGLADLARRPELEARLLAAIATPATATPAEHPLVLLAQGSLAELDLWPELQRCLAPRELRLAGLAARRRELPGILRCLLRREARRVRALPPVLVDVSPVWRQDWDLAGLAHLARQLVARARGSEVEPEDLEAQLAGQLGDRYRRRLPSKRPDPRAFWAALDSTRKRGGAFHRGRAAALLGWDPDTVSARIRDLGLADLG